MAYSDYGANVYFNNALQKNRSDAFLGRKVGKDHISIISTPGSYPGFYVEEFHNPDSTGAWHGLLGTAPVMVGLYKQTTFQLIKYFHPISDHEMCNYLIDDHEKSFKTYDYPERSINVDWYRENNELCEFEIDGYKISLKWEYTDNVYQYARLVEPTGDVWTGFSGYGVGLGFDGNLTTACESRVREIFKL